jgi:hypothetical protein
VGGALGVAILVAILGGHHERSVALLHFERMWFYAAWMAALSGAIAVLLGSAKPQRATAPTVIDTASLEHEIATS